MARLQSRQTKDRRSLVEALAKSVLGGDVRAAARVLSLIENKDPLAKEILKRVYPRTGRAHIVGITGSAGTGKSTLIGCMTAELRRRKKEVGILAVDPTSPFSGGAVLGDRVRMRDHFLDPGVFIRSLATRGAQGGLSGYVYQAAQLLEGLGKDYILIETIGIGQDQVEVAGVVHTVLVVVTPESGDEIQGLKAGMFEIADLLVINKSDLSGAEEIFLKVGNVLGDAGVPIVKTIALKNEGIPALIDGIEKRRVGLLSSNKHKQRTLEISRNQLVALIRDGLMFKVRKKMGATKIEHWAQRIAERESDPYTAAETILRQMHL
jgi:LAO/AO transport system kinase